MSETEAVLSRYLAHLAVERGLAANTLASYRRDLLRYVEHLKNRGRVTFGEVAEADVTAFLSALREGDEEHQALVASSAARAVSAVRGLHRFALREGVCRHDPAHEVHPPRQLKRLPKAISVDDVERLIAASGPDDAPLTLRNRALLELLYGTGARISEAVGLAVDDVDLGTEAQRVRLRGKGGRARLVPLGRFAREALGAYLTRARPRIASRGRGTSGLFLNARGGRLTRQGAWEVLQAAAERGGLNGVSPHMLRHSFATHLLDGGADVRVVQELLGHASVTTTQVYTLVTVDKLREVYAAAHPRTRH
ncbi:MULTISPECIES: site-specific tyrosine recombinase XerD [Streptosporangium]|uniref:site-specific tyrosine recombinase XerD n=1 Tax=Streptosporangium TaxID=2000 RepID=UPI000B78F5E1|nr:MULTISPECIES: site-specific tyrosine recombinase XerD [Streptosporangium]AWS42167.1 site-specific tyrosine recombinase XerD [Streptosporangium sp. 'caverna']WSA22563.1 site-specific tyrosine recombinase XerD [Streptosporangium subroseum]